MDVVRFTKEQIFEKIPELLSEYYLSQRTKEDYIVHQGITCHVCGTSPIRGVRYQCTTCDNLNLCELCELSDTERHTFEHNFIKIKKSTTILPAPLYDDIFA